VLASIDLSTGRVTELRDFDTCDQCGTEWPRSYPAWSPDRTQIAYTWAVTQLPGPQPPRDPAVFIADADGGNAHQVSAIGSLPSWSPDGTEIVFQGPVQLDRDRVPGTSSLVERRLHGARHGTDLAD
jgi:Tol biopolymer transport system component